MTLSEAPNCSCHVELEKLKPTKVHKMSSRLLIVYSTVLSLHICITFTLN